MNHPAQSPTETYWTDGDPDVPVFQRPQEFSAFLTRVEALRPARVLEIGTYYGGTLKQLLQRTAPGGLIVSLDRYDIPRADNRHRYPDWTPPGVTVVTLACDSNDPLSAAAAGLYGPFDLIFIDADHTEAAVRRDYDLYSPLIAPGGLIAFHDILVHPAHPEIAVNPLWDDLCARFPGRTEALIEDPAAKWGGIGLLWC